MSGPSFPDTPPPEVPEEFHAAYLEAFRRALEEGEGQRGAHVVAQESVPRSGPEYGPASGPESGEESGEVAGTGTTYRSATPWERLRESRAFVPVVVAALALVLIVGAYVAGLAFSKEVDGGTAPTGVDQGSPATARPTPTRESSPRPAPGQAIRPSRAKASCTAPPSQDSAGHRVTYDVARAIDGKADTAWRCEGKAVGETLVLTLPKGTTVARVGLVPGYAKTDERSGVDRYAENNRITRVRWHIGDQVVEQRLDPDPRKRGMQTIPVAATTTDEVSLEILGVRRGPRNTTAISELGLVGPVR